MRSRAVRAAVAQLKNKGRRRRHSSARRPDMPETRKENKNVCCSLSVPEIKQACHLVHCVLRSQIRNAQKAADLGLICLHLEVS